jgi:hypothetical protein
VLATYVRVMGLADGSLWEAARLDLSTSEQSKVVAATTKLTAATLRRQLCLTRSSACKEAAAEISDPEEILAEIRGEW